MEEVALGERAAVGGYDGGPQGACPGPDPGEIRAQLRRIACAGFVPSRAQRSPEGQAEYYRALADLSPELLALAVDRIIRDRTDHFFPLPAQIRAAVGDELAQISRAQSDAYCRRIRAEMRARYPGALIMAGD